MSKTDHCVIRNSNLFCQNCGREQVIPYPIDPDMFSAMSKQFCKSHKNCEKTWKEPEPDMSMTANQRANEWWVKGERGLSSEGIWTFMMGNKLVSGNFHPQDPSDFYRCYKLLKWVPEWKARMPEMKIVSPKWSKLIDNWDKLSAMVEEQIAGKENDMYEVMEALIK